MTAYSYVYYSGNGSNKYFVVPFPYLDKSHISLYVGGVAVTFTWLDDTNIIADVAPAAATNNVLIQRTTPNTVIRVNFSNGSTVTQDQLNQESKQQLYIIQETLDKVSRSIRIPQSDLRTTPELPSETSRALKGAMFDVNGDITAGTPLASGTVSAPMSSFVSAASIATARSLLGVVLGADINVKDSPYLATGDGVTDDSSAIQAAVNACIAAGGGRVLFPPGKYMLGSTIDISSDTKTVWLVGLGWATSGYQLSDEGNYIAPKNALPNGMIRFRTATGVGSGRARCGSGGVVGLTFLDPTASASLPGTRAIKAALSLEDFNFGIVRDCHFRNLNGSAIKSEFWVMGDLERSTFRYCGAASAPALWLGAVATGTATQSMAVRSCRFEVNHNAEYVRLDANSGDVKILGCGFESEDGGSLPTSQQRYIEVLGGKNIISDCHFNRTTKANVRTASTAGRNIIQSIRTSSTTTGVPSEARFIITDNNNVISDISADYGTTEDLLFSVTGFYNVLSNISALGSGGINLAAWNTLRGFFSYQSGKPSGYVIVAADGCVVEGCTVRSPATAAVGGIQTTGTYPRVLGCLVNGCGLGSTALNFGGATWVEGNIQYGNSGTAYSMGSSCRVARNEGIFHNYVTWNVGTVAAGAVTTNTVTVTGCAVGDHVRIKTTAASGGLILTGRVLAADTVTIQAFNPTGSGITPGSMDYTAVVER